MKIYHNPRCTKSRQTLKLIQDADVEPQIIEYLDTPPSVAELKRICKLLGIAPQSLIRRKEAKELGFVATELSHDEAISAMVENPKLIERPIVVSGDKAVLGRPPENVAELLRR